MKILTFDIEDWFHVLDNPETSNPKNWKNLPSRLEAGVDRIISILSKTNQPATFFCLGWIGEKYPEVVKKIVNSGIHLASHSYNHQLAYEQSKDQFKEDLWKSIDVLQQVSGKKIDTYRAPGFSITSKNLWAFEIISNMGIKTDCSIFPANRAHGGIPEYSSSLPSIINYKNTSLRSLPINTTKILWKNIVYSGGGYFRLLPQWFLNNKFQKDEYIMTYFHPRDFDPMQPMIPGLGSFRKFKSYVGLKEAQNKLEFLLKMYSFVNVDMAVNQIDWDDVQTVRLS